MPSVGNQFINYSDWLNLNQPDAQRMAQQLASGVQTQGQGANDALAQLQAAFSPTSQDPNAPQSLSAEGGWQDALAKAGTAQSAANQLGNAGGIAQALSAQYGGPANRFDAALAGSAGANTFADLQRQYGDLSRVFGLANDNSARQWNDPNNSRWRDPGAPMPQGGGQAAKPSNWAPDYAGNGSSYRNQAQGARNSNEGQGPYSYLDPTAGGNSHAYRGQNPGGAGRRNPYDASSGGVYGGGWRSSIGGY